MNIHEVVQRYFEGTSSVEDERYLKAYFSDSENVAEEYKYLQPLFNYVSDEMEALQVLNEIKLQEAKDENKGGPKVRKMIISISAIAASVMIGMFLLLGEVKGSADKSYVWIDGKKVSNPEVVNRYFEASFENVKSDDNILEQQLGSFFED